YTDLDNDGDLDLVVSNLNETAFVYQNHSENSGNNFLRVDLDVHGKNPDGIGAQVTLFSGEKRWGQRLSTSRGFQSGPSTTLVFGMGKTTAIDSIQVNWPDGDAEIFTQTQTDQSISLSQGTGKVTST